MAKITPMALIEGMSGKVCSHSKTYFSQNSSSGIIHTGRLCNPFKGEATEKQTAQRTKFAQRAGYASVWLNANKPTDSLPDGTKLYQEAQALKKTLQLSNVRQVIMKYMNAAGNVILPSEVVPADED